MGKAPSIMPKVYPVKNGITRGLNKPREKKGLLGAKVKMARSVIRELCGYAPYERRAMDLLNQGFDKRALKFCKKRLGTHRRGKAKKMEMEGEIQAMKMKDK